MKGPSTRLTGAGGPSAKKKAVRSVSKDSTKWLDLFDTGQMDYVADLILENVTASAEGVQCSMHEPLRRILIGPLSHYITEHHRPGVATVHGSAALRFMEVLERLASRFEDGPPFIHGEASKVAYAVRFAWLEFIAYGSAHRMYDDLPRVLEQRVEAASWPRADGKNLTLDGFVVLMKARGLVGVSKQLVAELKAKHGISEETIRRRLRDARTAGKLPKP